jgi:uridine kinase
MTGRFTQVVKRTGAIVPFTPERITNAIYRAAVEVGGHDRTTAEKLTEQVIAYMEQHMPPDHIPAVEEIQDVVEKILIENRHAKVAKAYILYRDERARARQAKAALAARPSGNIPWRKIWYVLDWAVEHGVHTVEALDERLARGEFPDIVHESDAAYEQDLENAAELVQARRDQVKIVIIAGPSSSGKTTTTIKLGMRLEHIGLKLVALNVDNYFFDLALHPKDEYGDYDFETPQALDLELINEHLVKLIAGQEIQMPQYDFKTGMQRPTTTPMRLAENEIILIDSLHGLFPGMMSAIPDERKFKLYIETLIQLKGCDGNYVRWTDLRLMRRMLRDAAHRSYDPQRTLEHWHYVRSSELRHIIPYINTTDYIVNGALPYELPVFRPRLMDQFARWSTLYDNDPQREDAMIRAKRVYALLQTITPVAEDAERAIPPTSHLREFIGGSVYKY